MIVKKRQCLQSGFRQIARHQLMQKLGDSFKWYHETKEPEPYQLNITPQLGMANVWRQFNGLKILKIILALVFI